jgi:hypothetical protein
MWIIEFLNEFDWEWMGFKGDVTERGGGVVENGEECVQSCSKTDF